MSCLLQLRAVPYRLRDRRSGVEAARAAGMAVLGYARRPTPAEWLEGPGTVVFTDMADLPAPVAAL